MNNRAIKQRADVILLKSKNILQKTMLIMLAISLLDNLFSTDLNTGLPLVAFIISVIFLPFSHGYIVMSLKAVRNREDEITTDDAFVGFKRFKELFFTYFLKGLFIGLSVLVFAIIGAIVLSPYITQIIDITNSAVAGDVDTLLDVYIWENLSGVLSIILLLFILAIIAAVFVGLMLFGTPYLLERYKLYGMDAIRESVKLMKGHKGELFMLELSFVGWTILQLLISGTVGALFSDGSIVGTLLATFVAGIFAIYTYMPKYILSLTIFFEEIAYQYFGDEHHEATSTTHEFYEDQVEEENVDSIETPTLDDEERKNNYDE